MIDSAYVNFIECRISELDLDIGGGGVVARNFKYKLPIEWYLIFNQSSNTNNGS